MFMTNSAQNKVAVTRRFAGDTKCISRKYFHSIRRTGVFMLIITQQCWKKPENFKNYSITKKDIPILYFNNFKIQIRLYLSIQLLRNLFRR